MSFLVIMNMRYKNMKHLPRNFQFIFIMFHYVVLMKMFSTSFTFLGNANPFQNLEKTSVLQEARTFNETPVNAKKCVHILTKILYILNQVIECSNLSDQTLY